MDALLAWYPKHRRDLPWRRTRDAYAVWISEAMLQQTRVEAVVPYFERFLARFPTVEALATADEDDVVAVWSGLGYYRRARALRAAARAIVERHGGRFPDGRRDALALPGVGPYTAGAVLSIAYGRPEPAVDGNVARVFARRFGLDDPLGSSELNRKLWRLAAKLLPRADPGAWNQALMELGATVCTPRSPRCPACPWREDCDARRTGRVESLPVPARKREPIDVVLEVALVEKEGEILLQRRPAGGRMARMWELPTREVGDVGLWPPEFTLPIRAGEPLGEIGHGITHHRIRARVRAGELGPGAAGGARWAGPREAQALALTGMARKILKRLGSAQERPFF